MTPPPQCRAGHGAGHTSDMPNELAPVSFEEGPHMSLGHGDQTSGRRVQEPTPDPGAHKGLSCDLHRPPTHGPGAPLPPPLGQGIGSPFRSFFHVLVALCVSQPDYSA